MKEININILSAYLPYTLDKLKLQTKEGRIVELDGISNSIKYYGRRGMLVGEETIATSKPLLRPMTDLLKENVEHLTVIKLNLLLGDGIRFSNFNFFLSIGTNEPHINSSNLDKRIPFNVFERVRDELLRDKFDIFGLIDAGLALPAPPKTYVYPFDKLVNMKPMNK